MIFNRMLHRVRFFRVLVNFALIAFIFFSSAFAVESRPASLSDESVPLVFEFGFRVCTAGAEAELVCEESLPLKKELDLTLYENGGECLNFTPVPFTPSAVHLAPYELQKMRKFARVKGSLSLLQGASLGCAYSALREYDETFLPLVLIETHTQNDQVNLLLSLARSSEKAGTQIESVEMTFENLNALRNHPSVFLRAREISRKENAIVFPFFKISSLKK